MKIYTLVLKILRGLTFVELITCCTLLHTSLRLPQFITLETVVEVSVLPQLRAPVHCDCADWDFRSLQLVNPSRWNCVHWAAEIWDTGCYNCRRLVIIIAYYLVANIGTQAAVIAVPGYHNWGLWMTKIEDSRSLKLWAAGCGLLKLGFAATCTWS